MHVACISLRRTISVPRQSRLPAPSGEEDVLHLFGRVEPAVGVKGKLVDVDAGAAVEGVRLRADDHAGREGISGQRGADGEHGAG